ncbi:sensor histidine kinase [Phenylobacterium deserti]|uniref:histidine kinase n=1 Tax=Phenylobacterium deserti TaxID=1914756 RepID=A0A328ACQ3_9CAUL|nr:histidine kinase dimerization/phosphoacceptor domain -containing protein [Phenylobacterium deserti]RAK52593.1 hypothetical protein DJ018_10315 [Phenylobacterium deserti]
MGGSSVSSVQGRPSAMRVAWASLIGIALVLAAAALHSTFSQRLPGLGAFGFFYPALLAAALLGGWLPAAVTLAISTALGWWFLLGPAAIRPVGGGPAANLVVYGVSGALVAMVGARLDTLLRRRRIGLARLAERELRYRTLFESVSDGFALVKAVRAPSGEILDYTVLEANPALLRLLRADESIIGKRQSEILRDPPPTWLQACETALKGAPVSFEFNAGRTSWLDIHLSRVSDDRLALFIVDITDRKVAEARHTELFDELNHRVKNNLAMVSAMLGMQARLTATPKVREDLNRAIDRIQTIADVHAALYRSSSKDQVDFATYLRDLCERLAGSLMTDDRVRLEVAAEPASLPLDKAVAMGVVVNELVTNAAKHAFPPPNVGVIRVCLRHDAGDLVLSVGDSGCGMPHEASSGKGLGMRLVRSLVQQLDGVLDIQADKGSTFTIRMREPGILPLKEAAQSRLL